ncbi:MAG: LamG domain-containing protein, partial [Actinomycetota bacterium]|nr:LamG domain-containing protein [Actinomycetota bacterium]
MVSQQRFNNPGRYSVEAWFKTDTRAGGKLIGFGSGTSTSGSYDRHVYMTDTGQLVFGTYTGSPSTISTSEAYNDNRWHHLVATQGVDGMRLYVDGVVRASNTTTDAQNYLGYWRIGG